MAADLDDPLALALRAAAADVAPSDALRHAVLDALGDRPAPSPRARLAPAFVAGALAVAAGLLVALWPRADSPEPRPPAPRADAPVAPPDADAQAAAVARARAQNRAIYAAEHARWPAGTWVSIAWRDPATVEGAYKPVVLGASLEDVAAAGADALHRYLFRVGEEGDVETFVSSWYAPRFAGGGLVSALGIESWQGGDAVVLVKGEHRARFAGATPFPRVRATIAAPDGSPPRRTGDATPELWFGSVGPALMLTPQDADELGLSRFEVPGTETVGTVPCRRVRVTVEVPGLDAKAMLIGAVPDVPYEALVAASRARHRFWEWGEGLVPKLALAVPTLPGTPALEHWIVFGNDRVLGRGASPQAAIEDADRFPDVVYQRYVLRWPRAELPVGDERATLAVRVALPGGVEVEGRVRPTALERGGAAGSAGSGASRVAVHVVPSIREAQWIRAGLHRAEGGDAEVSYYTSLAFEPGGRGAEPPPPPADGELRVAYAVLSVRPKDGSGPGFDGWGVVVARVVP